MKKFTIFNAESAYYYFTDEAFRLSILGSSPMYCDSASLSYVLRVRGIPHSRLHGPDFMDRYLRIHGTDPVLIIGGTAKAHDHIREHYQLVSVRCVDKYVSVDNITETLDEVDEFHPRIIFVCLGLRKQEKVTNAIWQHFNDNIGLKDTVVVGVGAAVDFLGKTKKRSGRVWQVAGLEWLPRLFREPRMAPRIVRSLAGCALAFAMHRKFESDNLTFAAQFDD
jgi:exopolysaccharide biosynthesis WecB/TagA/CpsF family protein